MKPFRNFKLHYLFFFIFSGFIFLSGCEKEKPDEEIVNFVWNYAQENPDGFTLNIFTKEPVTVGLSAAYLETQNSFGKESLPKVIDHSLKHEGIVGGWQNTENLLFYFDSDKVFPDSCLEEAIAFAKQNMQIAIYDITNDSLIWIEYPKITEFEKITGSEIKKGKETMLK